MFRVGMCVLLLGVTQGVNLSSFQDLLVSGHTELPPEDLVVDMRDHLAEGGTRVQNGQTVLDFWWVSNLPATKDLGSDRLSWEVVQEGSLVGAVRISKAYKDIRGRTIDAGVYTLRFGVQPADGDHLGISPYREFLLLSPASEDKNGGPISHNDLIGLSMRSINISHPAVWSLDPPVTDAELLTVQPTDEGHTAVVFEVPVSYAQQVGSSLRFSLILVGLIEF